MINRSNEYFRFLLLTATLLASQKLLAVEQPIKSRTESIGLFKNGLAVVRREVIVPGPGTYVLNDMPEPIHGTWWVESAFPIKVQCSLREVTVPISTSAVDFQHSLAGQSVLIHFKDGQIPPASGRVEAIVPKSGEEAWNRAYFTSRSNYQYDNSQSTGGRFLILKTDKERIFVDTSLIAYLKSDTTTDTVKLLKPVLILVVENGVPQNSGVRLSYLTKGMAWAPSYRIDISDPKTLSIEQSAVIKNELADLDGTEIQLISGFPSVHFAHVTSPLSLRTNWPAFFQQINQRMQSGDVGSNRAQYQQAIMMNSADPGQGMDLSAIPTGEGMDVNYRSIGVYTLKEGDSVSLSLAKDKSSYERVVEWIVPDTRNEYGNFIADYQRTQNPDKFDDAAWDAIRFKNPFTFAMTTAPAMVISKDHFNGQQMSFWVNSGEMNCLRVTKALSLRTRHAEHEEQGQRETVYIGGGSFFKTSVKGVLTVNNHRKEEVPVYIRRQFSGELLIADGNPKTTLREEGAYAVNQRNELTWTVVLKPGEEKTLNYRYSLLVRH